MIKPDDDAHPLATARDLAPLRAFYETDIDELLARHAHTDLGRFVLDFFHGVVREVPAYRRFLERMGIDSRTIDSIDAFGRLPCTTKENYHRASSLRDLCRGGVLESCDFLAVSSGSTGEPTVWPRFVTDEVGTSIRFEQVLTDAMRTNERRTLAVICFALGTWVGGMYTTSACRHLAAKGHRITVVTPGNNKSEILRIVRALGRSFEQIVLFGYPPFLKDVIDAGLADGLDWRTHAVRLITAGEVFSEEWRSLVCERIGANEPVFDTASLYGTADGGVLANETPLSIRIRRFLAEHPGAARELFGQPRLPTLCQYDPLHRYFETQGPQLLFTGDGGAPLVRYKILDEGGIVPFSEMLRFLRDHGDDPLSDLRGAASAGRPPALRDLPFVYVCGRSSFAVSFYGANVYPENVAVGLERPEWARHVTGKFVMQVVSDHDQNQRLQIVVELASGVEPSDALARDLSVAVRTELERLNSEFLNYAPAERRTPSIVLLPLAHPEYFPTGVKHRYTRS